jgi:Ca2+-binding RTX toxin-like protein
MGAVGRFSCGSLCFALAWLLATAALPAAAPAAEVSVSEESGEPNLVRLEYRAEPGENNHLTIAYQPQESGSWQISLVDDGATIAAGAGCTDGGAAGTAAHCRIHEPKFSEFEYCGKLCFRPIPGTAWNDSFHVSLGDGDNFFDGQAFAGTYGASVAMEVSSGDGTDQILTGNGPDTIDPGGGADAVYSNDGEDRVLATSAPDGPDLYDAGRSLDRLSYALRTAPVELHDSTAGAPGEGDSLIGWFYLTTGSADDVLVGGPHDLILDAGAGNDVVSGSAANSELYGGPGDDSLDTLRAGPESINHLVGEEGGDTYRGGPGTDIIREQELPSLSPPGAPPASSGDDVAYGGPGRDVIEMRGGRDSAYGEDGSDTLDGGGEGDVLSGGAGPDLLIGGSGFDLLRGGSGSDVIFSSHWHWVSHANGISFPFPPVKDDGPDRVSCGPGGDKAFANPWDRLGSCEQVYLRPHPGGKRKR